MPLSRKSFAGAVEWLVQRDPDLASIVAAYGPPPMWQRPSGFPTLVHIILEQQVSLASARAAFERLEGAVSPVTPDRFLELDPPTLRRIGFSRQKAGYCRGLALSLTNGHLDLEALAAMDDQEARDNLLSLKGVGRWTADIYLLMALRRPDVWPSGDLALRRAVHKRKRLGSLPDDAEMESLAADWRPWRAVAARMLWHDYLSSRKRATATPTQQ